MGRYGKVGAVYGVRGPGPGGRVFPGMMDDDRACHLTMIDALFPASPATQAERDYISFFNFFA